MSSATILSSILRVNKCYVNEGFLTEIFTYEKNIKQ